MARTKSFNPNDALTQARDAFWAEGYQAMHMARLLEAMGIHRGSFYDTFGSKRALLLAALDRYLEDRRGFVARVAEGRAPTDAIAALFASMIDDSRGAHACHGCLLVNLAVELAPRDPEVARRVREGLAELEDLFRDWITEARRRGRIRAEVEPEPLARSLVSQLVGLLVLVRAGVDREIQRSVVDQVRHTLSQASPPPQHRGGLARRF